MFLPFLEIEIQKNFKAFNWFFSLETTGFPKEKNIESKLKEAPPLIFHLEKKSLIFLIKSFGLEKFLFQTIYGFYEKKNKNLFARNL